MAGRFADVWFAGRVFARAGMARAARPDRLVRAFAALRRYGPTLAAGYRSCAALPPMRGAGIDARGAGGPRPDGDPDLRDDRHAEGREPGQPRFVAAGRRAAGSHPAPRRRADGDRRAAVSLLGLRPFLPVDGSGLDARVAPPLRPR